MFLGLDASTQSITALIIDPKEKAIIATEQVHFGSELPQYHSPNGFLQHENAQIVHANPLMWVEALELLFIKMKNNGVDLSQIKAISGAGQQHATVYLADNFAHTLETLNPKLSLASQLKPCLARLTAPIWMDSSTETECQEITETLQGSENVCKLSGSIAIERFSASQIRKFSKEEPENYAATHTIHLNSSFFASILAGSSAPIDYGDGAGMNLMNLASLNWDKELLHATVSGISSGTDLEKKLPKLKPAGFPIGSISPYFVKKYGFSRDCQALSWTGDNPASLVGMGAAKPGSIVISLGTSDTFFASLSAPKTDPNGYGHTFGNPLSDYMILSCVSNGSLSREQVREQTNLSWDDFEKQALSLSGETTKIALPFFKPETTPKINSNQVYTNGWDFNSVDSSTKLISAIQGQFLNMKAHTKWMGTTPKNILLTGGAAKNKGIAQIIANIFQVNVKSPKIASSVALGAAIRAAITHHLDYSTLVEAFCHDFAYSIDPNCPPQDYQKAEQATESLIKKISGAV